VFQVLDVLLSRLDNLFNLNNVYALFGNLAMPAYVHVNLRIIDAAKQAALAPRFQAALQQFGGRITHFGPVTEVLEGADTPLPMAGIFEFETKERALEFYNSEQYAPIKEERRQAQEARMFIVEAKC
jgi:uncharacterized protein (DUF1330 family)